MLELIVKKKEMWQLEELSLELLKLDRNLLGLQLISFFADDIVIYGNRADGGEPKEV